MSTIVMNHVPGMVRICSQEVDSFGLDNTKKIKYRFNSGGFRGSRDFDFLAEYAFFGCSLVFGIGVPEDQTFPYLFNNAHNYGLAGNYDNHDVLKVLLEFIDSDNYSDKTKIAVIWHERDADSLDDFYHSLKHLKIEHFFCGNVLPYANCYRVPPNLDWDVSNSHYGIKSHRFLWKILCQLFQQ